MARASRVRLAPRDLTARSPRPDPSARAVDVVPLLVDPQRWHNEPDGPVAALREVATEAHHPDHQAAIALQAGTRDYQQRVLAYLFMYPRIVEHESDAPTEVRCIDAVATDGTIYVLTRMPDTDTGLLATIDDPGDNPVIDLLRQMMTLTYPDGSNL
ncbi:hypothetical protein [Micromonospora tarensis]|uniref:Uncharacterized protein n=1 Tax=Micromonospora tarensis TaxID=2806100 RepID=A0ABS1Y9E5_9ACTN|nr:hypothetical protein [Micromonospora tarensis]MBM0274000.1 hypothetical protein [Micromonospora tarensis]